MLNSEAFELIEKRGEEGVTAEYLSKRLGVAPRSAASWLSKWTRRGFLKYIPFDGATADGQEELERREHLGTITMEEQERLKILKEWRYRTYLTRGHAGRPGGSQGKYVLGLREWGAYRYGKLEERMALRDGVKKW